MCSTVQKHKIRYMLNVVHKKMCQLRFLLPYFLPPHILKLLQTAGASDRTKDSAEVKHLF